MANRTLCTLFAVALACAVAGAESPAPQAPQVPSGVGVFLWWNPEDPAAIPEEDVRRISRELGAGWVRFFIQRTPTERVPGSFDFSGYHQLFKMLKQYGLRPMMILGGDFDRPYVRTQQERDEFMRWAVAAVDYVVNVEERRDGVWESWNEPNCSVEDDPGCWTLDEYCAWARQLAEQVFTPYPDQVLIGPSSAGTAEGDINDLAWLEGCFRRGMLAYWKAVAVHPYPTIDPHRSPEDLDDAYRRLRELVDYYTPPGGRIPIVSTEQGDCSDFDPWWGGDWEPPSEELQGKRVARMNLLNEANGITLNMDYDWRDAAVSEWDYGDKWAGRCGLLRGPEAPTDGDDRKPAWFAMETFLRLVHGTRPAGRTRVGDAGQVLRFDRSFGPVYAAWSTVDGGEAETSIPLPAGDYEVLSHLGERIGALRVCDGQEARLDLDDAPRYIVPAANEGDGR